MTLSKKYNEIMDKVIVTDEMRRRVLREISNADPERLAAYKMDADEDLSKAFSGRKRYPASKILAGLAVACVLILIAGIVLRQPVVRYMRKRQSFRRKGLKRIRWSGIRIREIRQHFRAERILTKE